MLNWKKKVNNINNKYNIETKETGTRHRTAERTAKQTKELVISISQRRSVITIYKDNWKYIIEDTSKTITKANQALQTLDNYRKVFDTKLNILNEYEFNDIVTLDNVISAIQRAEMVMKVSEEVQRKIYELGEDGRLITMQLEELIGNVEKDEMLIIKDYLTGKKKNADKVFDDIVALNREELMKEQNIAKLLGYGVFDNYEEVAVYPKGYRILNKIPKMPNNIVENLVKSFKTFQNILLAEIEALDAVEGIGEVRANTIKQSLRRMQEQFAFDNLMV